MPITHIRRAAVISNLNTWCSSQLHVQDYSVLRTSASSGARSLLLYLVQLPFEVLQLPIKLPELAFYNVHFAVKARYSISRVWHLHSLLSLLVSSGPIFPGSDFPGFRPHQFPSAKFTSSPQTYLLACPRDRLHSTVCFLHRSHSFPLLNNFPANHRETHQDGEFSFVTSFPLFLLFSLPFFRHYTVRVAKNVHSASQVPSMCLLLFSVTIPPKHNFG